MGLQEIFLKRNSIIKEGFTEIFKIIEGNKKRTDKVDDYDRARFFAEDVQSIAADCGLDMEISYEEAERVIKAGYNPEDYYEYKASTLI